jgi:deoxyribodipyrimidine photo-lyase
VLAVNAASVVPPLALDQGVRTTAAFRRRHQAVREQWYAWHDEAPGVVPYDGPLPYAPDQLADLTDAEIDALVATCAIDHALPPSPIFAATRADVLQRLARLQTEVLPDYADARREARRPEGASALSPYLHFGAVPSRERGHSARAPAASAPCSGTTRARSAARPDTCCGCRRARSSPRCRRPTCPPTPATSIWTSC